MLFCQIDKYRSLEYSEMQQAVNLVNPFMLFFPQPSAANYRSESPFYANFRRFALILGAFLGLFYPGQKESWRYFSHFWMSVFDLP